MRSQPTYEELKRHLTDIQDCKIHRSQPTCEELKHLDKEIAEIEKMVLSLPMRIETHPRAARAYLTSPFSAYL